MTTISNKVQIDASPEQIWEILSDLGEVMNYHPYVNKSYYVSDEKEGVGASRICEFNNGMKLNETAANWQEGEAYDLNVDILEGPKPPVKDSVGTLRVQPNGGGAVVTMEVRYQTKYGPVGSLMDVMMVRPQYSKMVPNILRGLKHYAETGEAVDTGMLDQLEMIPVTT